MGLLIKLASHIHILQREVETGAFAKLNDSLEIVNFFAGHTNQIVHDLRLNLQTRVFNQFRNLFGILLCQSIFYTHFFFMTLPL